MLSTGPKYKKRAGAKNIQPGMQPDCTFNNHQKKGQTGFGWDWFNSVNHQSTQAALTDTT